MNAPSNVLVTCGGKWVGVVVQLRKAMREVPPLQNGEVFVADREAVAPAAQWADRFFQVPGIREAGYVDSLLRICRGHGVRVLVPLIDVDLLCLTHHLDRFAAVGTRVVCPRPDLTELCFDKAQFDAFARREGIDVPQTFAPEALDRAAYPLFYKPRRGFGGVGSGVCHSPLEARRVLDADPEVMFQECLRGQEVSVDAYIASSGRCTVQVQRVRDKVVDGEVARAHTVKLPHVREAVTRTIDALARRGLRGPVTVQVFATPRPPVTDVNPRLGSGNVLGNVASRGRLLRALLQEACGIPARGHPDDYDEGVCLYRYLGDTFHNGTQTVEVLPAA